ncbi:MAG: DNA mismatch repair protein MutL, partial [Longicatena sp.]
KVVSEELIIPAQEEVIVDKKPINPSLPQLRVIGQFHNCYILAEGEKGLYIIDQHAAQERYHYEVIREQILKGITDAQPLLLPITIESTISAVSQIDDINALLEQLGIHLEAFGNTTLVCRELPIWMKDIAEEAFLTDMIDIWERDSEISIDKLRKHAIATMACHSSIRFNRSLTLEEMKQVIDDLGKCEQPFHCPHGRPTLICMEDKALIKEFERG